MRTRILSHVAALLAAGAAAAAEPPPGGIPDLVGPRSLGLSASVGVAGANEMMFVNPAAMAVRKRYALETFGTMDRRGGDTVGGWFGASVVDSMSAPVTAGFGYVRAQKGDYTGNLWNLALAGHLADRLYLGVAAKGFQLSGPLDVKALTLDAGLFWQVADLLSIGATGYNLIPIAKDLVAPVGLGVGAAIGSDQGAQITGEWRADFDRLGKTANRYAVGAEVLLGKMFPLRAGILKDDVLDTTWWSAGIGVASSGGVSLDVGYRQSFQHASARMVAASLKLFLFN